MRRFLAGLRLAWQVANAPGMAGALQRIACLDEAIISSDSRLTEYVRTHVGTYRHALGTVPMGVDDDPCAVLDQHCRVRGLDSLSVVDASVFPRAVQRSRLGLGESEMQHADANRRRVAA